MEFIDPVCIWVDLIRVLLVSRMGRTTSLWQQALWQKDLQWPLTPGSPTAGPKVGKTWKLSSTTTARHPLGQHDYLTLTLEYHLLKFKYSVVNPVHLLNFCVQTVPAEWEVQSAAQHEHVWGHPCGAQQCHGGCLELIRHNVNMTGRFYWNALDYTGVLV